MHGRTGIFIGFRPSRNRKRGVWVLLPLHIVLWVQRLPYSKYTIDVPAPSISTDSNYTSSSRDRTVDNARVM